MIVGLIIIGTSTSFAQIVAGSTLTGLASSLQELGAIAAYVPYATAPRWQMLIQDATELLNLFRLGNEAFSWR